MTPIFDISLIQAVVVAVLAYLLGAVPFGIVAAKLFGLGDLRQIGSGNIGATNVLRTGNKPAAFLTLVGDIGKGAAAVLIARYALGETAAQIAGFAAFLGHCFPIYLGFKGGKGVATFLGTVLALSFPIGAACCLTWLATAGILRISSASALVASASGAIWALIFGHPEMTLLLVLLAALIWWRHQDNIKRILTGTEPKIGKKS
ncbi:MAG: glycerol-3-phosphate 1-O-acyltransferase PlsY [Pseudomonadota bacterium]